MDGSALGDAIRNPLLLGFGCPDGFWVGWGVSEVQAAFVTTVLATSKFASPGYFFLFRFMLIIPQLQRRFSL
jgi:hypothetical protein